jgi:hypothetical protein
MADVLWIKNRGRDGWSSLLDVALDRSVETRNAHLYDSGLGTRRGGLHVRDGDRRHDANQRDGRVHPRPGSDRRRVVSCGCVVGRDRDVLPLRGGGQLHRAHRGRSDYRLACLHQRRHAERQALSGLQVRREPAARLRPEQRQREHRAAGWRGPVHGRGYGCRHRGRRLRGHAAVLHLPHGGAAVVAGDSPV